MLKAPVADDALGALRGRIQRAFLATGLACALATGLLFAALPPPVSDRLRWAMVLGYLAVGLACAVVLRLGRAAIERATPAVMVMLLAVLGSSSLANGWGLGAPGLAFLSLIACMACAVAAPGPGRAVVVLAAALPLALGAVAVRLARQPRRPTAAGTGDCATGGCGCGRCRRTRPGPPAERTPA